MIQTSADWLACEEPRRMLATVRHPSSGFKLSDRKLRLFCVACCRQIPFLLGDERCREAVHVAERFADGRATEDQLHAAEWLAFDAYRYATLSTAEGREQRACACSAAQLAACATRPLGVGHCVNSCAKAGADKGRMATFLRDIAGNPFLPASVYSWYANVKPASLTGKLNFRREWVSPAVRAIALAAYTDRDWGLLPVLADALEDADCDEPVVLDHLRGPGPHVRGCWAVDLVLEKT